MKAFNSRLADDIASRGSRLCVGLDLAPESPSGSDLNGLRRHSFRVIEATRDLAVAFKTNLAFFERWGRAGFAWLEEILAMIGDELIRIGDAKRGDIGSSAKHYAHSLFDHFGFDAVTVNPYMGREAIQPFLEDPGKGAFILCRTSNPSAADLQDLSSDGQLVYEKVAQLALRLNGNRNVGLVMGATRPEAIARVRELAPGLPLLIPGVGAQGGDLEDSLRAEAGKGPVLINVSRGISQAGDGSTRAIRRAALNYLEQIRATVHAT